MSVVLVDYGMGNVLSVRRAFEHFGAGVHLSDDPAAIEGAERLVLPGVGAFADCMKELTQRGLVGPLRRYAERGRPFLGICLGMQMLLDETDEFGVHKGLGVIPGRVESIPSMGADRRPHKIPHIGWNALRLPRGRTVGDWAGTILADIPIDSNVYFVHSFTARPQDPSHRLADADYDGCVISAAIRQGSVYGCQFHPEKSGPVGLKIIRSFLSLTVST